MGTEEYAIGGALAAAAAVVSSVRVVTYNIHTCVGVCLLYTSDAADE